MQTTETKTKEKTNGVEKGAAVVTEKAWFSYFYLNDGCKRPYATVVVMEMLHDPSTVYVGVARCAEYEQFRFDAGRAFAVRRLKAFVKDNKGAYQAGIVSATVLKEELTRMKHRKPSSYDKALLQYSEFCKQIGVKLKPYEGNR